MNTVITLLLLISASLVVSAPTSDDEKLHIDNEFFPEQQVIYTADHEIVSLFVPINNLNFDEDDESEHPCLFFALADEDENGQQIDQGLYVLKEGKATKLLDFGRDSTADKGDDKLAYFAAKDGIYRYDHENNKAIKYGTVTDNIIKIAKANGTDVFYIITDSHQVYKVTEEGTVKSEILSNDGFVDLALDLSNNLFLLTEKSELVTIDDKGNKIFIDIPSDGETKKLIRPTFVEDSIICAVGKKVYTVFVNGTYEDSDFVLEVKPSAFALDATLIQYYALNKKIYEYNILALMLEGIFDRLTSFFDDNKLQIQSLATRSRSDMRP